MKQIKTFFFSAGVCACVCACVRACMCAYVCLNLGEHPFFSRGILSALKRVTGKKEKNKKK